MTSDEKDRKIESLTDALRDMCYQFASRQGRPNPGLHHMFLSALEGAFDELGWGDFHDDESVACQVKGCTGLGSCGTPTLKDGYKYCCYKCYAEFRKGMDVHGE